MNKLKYDEKNQLKTRMAILESQLNIANRETKLLKLHMNKPSKYFKKGNWGRYAQLNIESNPLSSFIYLQHRENVGQKRTRQFRISGYVVALWIEVVGVAPNPSIYHA